MIEQNFFERKEQNGLLIGSKEGYTKNIKWYLEKLWIEQKVLFEMSKVAIIPSINFPTKKIHITKIIKKKNWNIMVTAFSAKSNLYV